MQKCAGHFHPLFCSYVIPHTELRCFLLLRLIARSRKIVRMSKAFVREWLITICTQFAGNIPLHSQESRRSQKPTNRPPHLLAESSPDKIYFGFAQSISFFCRGLYLNPAFFLLTLCRSAPSSFLFPSTFIFLSFTFFRPCFLGLTT